MSNIKPALRTGEHFFNGDVACAEGAIASGCRFFAGYPITPATEIAEAMSARMPEVGGIFIQMEDEIASMNAILGASSAGVKSMSATSGPGFSLMMENFGLGIMMEIPAVLVNIQRGGPSTGLPTITGQQDMMQARWGSHGDYEVIALAPSSPQDMFDYTIRAFNLSEKFRIPVLVMADEIVGHMTEKVVIPW
jgi:2-oxoglutarate ferredoxin oxidoreductase subunit alpha